MSPSATNIQSIVYDPAPFSPLKITSKRYTRPDTLSFNDPSAFTLILTHGIGFHGEYWEPTIEKLFELSSQNELQQNSGFRIREVWSIDNIGHGQNILANSEELLKPKYSERCVLSSLFVTKSIKTICLVSGAMYGQAIHLLLTNKSPTFGYDFSSHKLVGVGHSFGSIGL